MTQFHGKSLLPLVLLTIAAGSAAVQAQDTDFSKWECKRCPENYGWTGELDFGLDWLSDDSLRFGNYRGLEEKGFYAAVDGEAHYRDGESRYVDVRTRHLGLDSREIEARGGRQGRYEIRLGWHEIPTYRGYGAQTPFIGQGGGALDLPADWVTARNTSDMTQLHGSLTAAPLKLQRKVLDAGLTLKFGGRWSWDIDAQRQDKSGTRPFGGAGIFLNNASLLPAPVDFTTDQVTIGLSWGNRRGQVRLGFFGSWFDNGRQSLTWDNPFNSTPETAVLRSALEPDNQYQQFSLTGAYSFTPRIHVSAHAATGKMKQDEAFLPYSINPDFSNLLLPRQSLDGKVDVGVFNLGGKFFARLNSRLSFTARAKYDERDNRTPVDVYTPVTTDVVATGPRQNKPYSFERRTYSADLRWRAHRTVRLSAGGKRHELERTYQAVEDSDETTWWGEIKWTPLARAQFRVKYEDADRNVSEYRLIDDANLSDHPLMRKYNQADRDRRRLQAEIYLTPLDSLGVNFSFYEARDQYKESVIGLQEGEVRSYTISADYALSGKVTLYGFVTHDKIDSNMIGTNSTPANAWTGRTNDKITTAGLGFSANLGERATLGLDLVSADSKGDITVRTGASDAPFTPLRTDLLNARLRFDYRLNEKWGYRLLAEYEDFSSQDWAIDGLGVDGIDSVLTFGRYSPNYDIWHLRAQASYRF